MSRLDEKLERNAELPGAKARATLKQLMARWGRLELVTLSGMEKEVWRHVGGTGVESVFEKQEGP